MKAKKDKNVKRRFSFTDIKFALYSGIQALNAVLIFVLVIRITTFTPKTDGVKEFLTKADNDLKLSIQNTASVVSNLVCLVYQMPQLSAVSNDSVNAFVSSLGSPSVSSNDFKACFVEDYAFTRNPLCGVSSFTCSDVGGSFSVGDLWIDGSHIIAIHDKGFDTSLSPWFAKSIAKPKKQTFTNEVKSNDLTERQS